MSKSTPDGPIRVVFVCLGNICRSPMAEAVFNHLVQEAGLEARIEVDSAGTGHWHVGEPPHKDTRRLLERHGVPYSHRARLLTERDLEEADYLIPMDRYNLRDIQALGKGPAKVIPLLEFAPGCGLQEVPDPYYDGRFELVYDLVRQGCAGLLEAIRRDHGL